MTIDKPLSKQTCPYHSPADECKQVINTMKLHENTINKQVIPLQSQVKQLTEQLEKVQSAWIVAVANLGGAEAELDTTKKLLFTQDEAMKHLELERDQLKEQLRTSEGENFTLGLDLFHSDVKIAEAESQVKQLTEENIGLRELNNGLNYCAEQSDLKRKEAESRLAKAQSLPEKWRKEADELITESKEMIGGNMAYDGHTMFRMATQARTLRDDANELTEALSPSALKGEAKE